MTIPVPPRPVRPLASALPCLLALAAAATGSATAADGWSGSLSAELDGGYDSNPTQGSTQAANRTHGDRDAFAEGQAAARLSIPLVPAVLPLVLKGRADDREYSRAEAEDHVLIHSAAELPARLGDTTIAPQVAVDDEWYGDAYYSTTRKGSLRWTQDWSADWSSDLVPFLARTSYRPPNRPEDGTLTGIDASATWFLPRGHLLRTLTLELGVAHYDARTFANTFDQATLGLDQDWRLGWEVGLELDAAWLPTVYQAPTGGRRGERHDRIFELDAALTRPLAARFDARLVFSVTNDHSNRPNQQYHQAVVSLGVVWTAAAGAER